MVASLLLAAPVGAQEAKEPKEAKKASKKGQPDQAAMMAAWQKYATPGENHARLKAFAGSWTAAVKMWMAPDAPPQESAGTEEAKLIMGDRYLQADFKGTFNGQPFSGVGFTGYDNGRKKFVGVWIDNMGTGIMTSEGTCDAEGKVYTYAAMATDPMTGKTSKSRMVMRVDSDTKHTKEMYGKGPSGKEYKMMEIVYTRKGASARAP